MELEKDAWEKLILELTAERPKEELIKLCMKNVGLKPKGDLVACMEMALLALEDRQHKREVDSEAF